MKQFVIKIEGGQAVMLYDDAALPVMNALGTPVTRRASHVEPSEDGTWSADMSPVGGPVLPGYPTRAAALQAEVAWLRLNRQL